MPDSETTVLGDEVRRTQSGNNNAYCQDNETSWFDWRLLSKHADIHRFVTQLNAQRALRDLESERQNVSLNRLLRQANLVWHGVKLGLNAYWEPLDFELPQPDKSSENPWRRWIDTALDSPHDIVQWETAESVPGYAYRTQARSVVVLFCGSLR